MRISKNDIFPINRACSLSYLLGFAALFCFVFGSFLLVFVMAPGDGTWVLYAKEMVSGKRLYSDLGLNQQPVFPLLSWLFVYLSPKWILGQKVVFLCCLFFYVYVLFRLCFVLSVDFISKSILLLALFFVGIHFEAFRFDDYHALAHVGVYFSLYMTCKFVAGEVDVDRYSIWQALVITLVFLTRVNEGAALFSSVAMVFCFHFRSNGISVAPVLKGILVGFVVFFLVLFVLGESPEIWWAKTIVQASSAKGGAGVINYPVKLFSEALLFLGSNVKSWVALVVLVLFFVVGWVFKKYLTGLKGAVAACCFVIEILNLLRKYIGQDFIVDLTSVAVLAVFLFSFVCLCYFVFAKKYFCGNRGVIVFYPFFLFAFGSLSTGGFFYGLYFPLAVTIYVLVYFSQEHLKSFVYYRVGLGLVLAIVAFQGAVFRANNPYSWHSYHVNPLFVGYKFVRDENLGMYFAPDQLISLITPVCKKIKQGDQLLSLPFSFANYYCGVDPWHGYVQTFFDTTTVERMTQLENDLLASPPEYIFYQRQLDNLSGHEKIFNNGKPLPHRRIDALIMRKISEGDWSVVYQSNLYPPSDWILISTVKN